MIWHRILCSILGHKLHLVEIHYADVKKPRYRYECSRCGQRFRYATTRDQAVANLLEIETNKILSRMQRYYRCIK